VFSDFGLTDSRHGFTEYLQLGGATKGEGLPDVEVDFGSSGRAAAAKCAIGQANTASKLHSRSALSRCAHPGGHKNMPFDFPSQDGCDFCTACGFVGQCG